MVQMNQEIYWFPLKGHKVVGVGTNEDEDGFLIEFPEKKELDHLIISRSELEHILETISD